MSPRKILDEFPGTYFNSAISANFKDLYDNIVRERCKQDNNHLPSQTFAPSSFRCDRLSYFRLRGVPIDEDLPIDVALNFKADMGTHCHKIIQRNLKYSIGNQWVNVSDYLASHPLKHTCSISNFDEFETQLQFFNPPVKLSCDGLLNIGDVYYLLEIKTCEYQSFKKLSSPKDEHIDQVMCYCSLLELNHALVLYQERNSGEIKCFEVTVTDDEMQNIFDRMNRVLQYVEDNIAPPKLPTGDFWCTYCKYRKRCSQWG